MTEDIPILQLKRQIEDLSNDQAEALRKATFVGMLPEEAKACDERREKITALMQELMLRLEAAKRVGPCSVELQKK